MIVRPNKKTLTAEEFARKIKYKHSELANGHVVEKAMGNEASSVTVNLTILLGMFVRQHRLGWVFGPEAGFILGAQTIRKPDVSFVRLGRLPNERPARGFETLAPDLVVEVVSPRDVVEELEGKVQEYIAAGVGLVWVVHPAQRIVRVYTPDGAIATFQASETLSGGTVLPGFECTVSEVFDLQRPPQAGHEAS